MLKKLSTTISQLLLAQAETASVLIVAGAELQGQHESR